MRIEVPVICSQETFQHNPQYEIHKGERVPHLDSVERVLAIKRALKESGFANFKNIDVSSIDGMPWIRQVHDSAYLRFLQRASRRIRGLVPDEEVSPGEMRALYPQVFGYSSSCRSEESEAEIGLFAFDLYTPVMRHTFAVAVDSARCALAGAEILRRGEPYVYVLTRPPGHHAEKDKMGGYCYLNNDVIAAQYLIGNGAKRVAILDVDLHHGNGVQNLTYERGDIAYISLHGDPRFTFPYFSGYEDETGENAGQGTKHNFPLPKGTEEELYHETLKKALRKIAFYDPDYLIVAAGFDTHKDDPFQTFKLSTSYYWRLGKEIKRLKRRTLVLQEGGYNPEVLGESVVVFLRGLLGI